MATLLLLLRLHGNSTAPFSNYIPKPVNKPPHPEVWETGNYFLDPTAANVADWVWAMASMTRGPEPLQITIHPQHGESWIYGIICPLFVLDQLMNGIS